MSGRCCHCSRGPTCLLRCRHDSGTRRSVLRFPGSLPIFPVGAHHHGAVRLSPTAVADRGVGATGGAGTVGDELGFRLGTGGAHRDRLHGRHRLVAVGAAWQFGRFRSSTSGPGPHRKWHLGGSAGVCHLWSALGATDGQDMSAAPWACILLPGYRLITDD